MESLRVAVLPLGGLFETNISDTGKVEVVGGLEAEFVKMLSQGLGMKFNYIIPKDYDWGQHINGRWTGLVGMAHRDEADMALAKITLSIVRAEASGYSIPYTVDELTFGTRLPGTLPNAAAFVNPFSTNVWICFFILLLIYPVFLRFLLSKRYKFQLVFLNVFASLLTKPLSIKVFRVRDRILLMFWLLGALVIALSYQGLLLSFMTVPLRERGVRNVPELAKVASTGEYKCVTVLGTGSVEFLTDSTEPDTKSIGDNMQQHEVALMPERKTILEEMYKDKIAVVASRYDLEYLLTPYAYVAPDTFVILPSSVFLSKEFKHTKKLDNVILRITAAGLYQKTVRDYTFQQQLDSEEFVMEAEEGPQQLQLADLYGAFVLLVSGGVISIMAFVAELASWKRRKKLKRNKRCK